MKHPLSDYRNIVEWMLDQQMGQKIEAAEDQQQKEGHPSRQSIAPNIPNYDNSFRGRGERHQECSLAEGATHMMRWLKKFLLTLSPRSEQSVGTMVYNNLLGTFQKEMDCAHL